MFFAKIILNATFADNFNSFVGLAPVSTIDGTPSNLIKIAIDLHLADILNLISSPLSIMPIDSYIWKDVSICDSMNDF